jgi:formylglycine-generating enzyme required for sulfatase activity
MTGTKFYIFSYTVICLAITVFASASPEPPKRYTESFKAEDGAQLQFEMVLIWGGRFLMGSGQDEAGREDDEGPRHEVVVSGFYLCTTETTLELFIAYYEEKISAKMQAAIARAGDSDVIAVTCPTPVYGDLTMGYDKNHPAMGMTWHNAVNFCQWLSEKTGRVYRLPTEAEWEYACRAGTDATFSFGDDPNRLKDYCWYEDNSFGETHEVGTKKANALGLYDMSGNIREWVYDFYSPTAYAEAAKNEPTINPTGPEAGKVHVARGGDFNSSVDEQRCAARAFEEGWWRMGDPQMPKSKWWLPDMDIIGFRVARSAEAVSEKGGGEDNARLRFSSSGKGEYEFDTGIVRGKLRQRGKSLGLSSVEHIPSGVRLDGAFGILSYYRVFTTNKRYGTAAWEWPNESKLQADGSVKVRWPACKERPFELTGVYRWSGSKTLDVETIVKAEEDLSDFEVFLASYFQEDFPQPYVYVREEPEGEGKGGFLLCEKSLGDWQMFARGEEFPEIIDDGRWRKEPNPVDWAVMPSMAKPLCFRRGANEKATAVLMAPMDDCFAIASPYEGESHYSLYLSLFGCDVKSGETATARSRFVITGATSESEIVKLYENYMKEVSDKEL